jgi:hypothetical protein
MAAALAATWPARCKPTWPAEAGGSVGALAGRRWWSLAPPSRPTNWSALLQAAGAVPVVVPLIEIVADPTAAADWPRSPPRGSTGWSSRHPTARQQYVGRARQRGPTLGRRHRVGHCPCARGPASPVPPGSCRPAAGRRPARRVPPGSGSLLLVQAAAAEPELAEGLAAAGLAGHHRQPVSQRAGAPHGRPATGCALGRRRSAVRQRLGGSGVGGRVRPHHPAAGGGHRPQTAAADRAGRPQGCHSWPPIIHCPEWWQRWSATLPVTSSILPGFEPERARSVDRSCTSRRPFGAGRHIGRAAAVLAALGVSQAAAGSSAPRRQPQLPVRRGRERSLRRPRRCRPTVASSRTPVRRPGRRPAHQHHLVEGSCRRLGHRAHRRSHPTSAPATRCGRCSARMAARSPSSPSSPTTCSATTTSRRPLGRLPPVVARTAAAGRRLGAGLGLARCRLRILRRRQRQPALPARRVGRGQPRGLHAPVQRGGARLLTGITVVDLSVPIGDAGRSAPVAGTPSAAPTARSATSACASRHQRRRLVLAFTSDATSS